MFVDNEDLGCGCEELYIISVNSTETERAQGLPVSWGSLLIISS